MAGRLPCAQLMPIRERDLIMGLIDVDFSLAMHNRTGKFFVGLDLIDAPEAPLGDVLYWKSRSRPQGLRRRIYGRLQLWQVKASTGTARGIEMLGRLIPAQHSVRDVLHLDPFTVPTRRLRRTDIVVCHDLGPVSHPYLFDRDVGAIYRRIYEEIDAVGPHLVFVSETSRREYLAFYSGANLASHRVIYPSIRTMPAGEATPGNAVPGLDGPFLLTVGSIGFRKNQTRCVAGFAASGLARKGVRYVLCGGREPGFEEVRDIALRTPGVVLLPYVTDAQLAWLYRNAQAFVLASLLEGFGIPVAEAGASGLVPLVSAGSVLEEVAGEGGLCVNPDDPMAIAEGMQRLIDMSVAEKAERLRLLAASLARFDVSVVREAWRSACSDWSRHAAC